MRIYFFLGKNLSKKDFEHAIFGIEVMVTGYGFEKERFEIIKRQLRQRDFKYFENDALLIAFDCRLSRVKALHNPDYEQSLLGNREAFMWTTEDDGKWQCISPAGCKELFIEGRKTYVDCSLW
ncbi:MAG: hypothetical protein J6V57_04790 [Spirochaetaceae bacterium]|nr:hypothetical protein [Spirochaetaceae bacterium]